MVNFNIRYGGSEYNMRVEGPKGTEKELKKNKGKVKELGTKVFKREIAKRMHKKPLTKECRIYDKPAFGTRLTITAKRAEKVAKSHLAPPPPPPLPVGRAGVKPPPEPSETPLLTKYLNLVTDRAMQRQLKGDSEFKYVKGQLRAIPPGSDKAAAQSRETVEAVLEEIEDCHSQGIWAIKDPKNPGKSVPLSQLMQTFSQYPWTAKALKWDQDLRRRFNKCLNSVQQMKQDIQHLIQKEKDDQLSPKELFRTVQRALSSKQTHLSRKLALLDYCCEWVARSSRKKIKEAEPILIKIGDDARNRYPPQVIQALVNVLRARKDKLSE